MMYKNYFVALIGFFALIASNYKSDAADGLALVYHAPGGRPINEGLPIGNGSLGALISGNPECERMTVSEDSLWTGDENPGGDDKQMGAYQYLGDTFIQLEGQTNISGYTRSLDIITAVASVDYTAGGVRYHREFFSSHPAGVMIARFTADRKGALSGVFKMVDSHGAASWHDGSQLIIQGTLTNGLNYEWRTELVARGGKINSASDKLAFTHCDELCFIIAGATDYAMDPTNHFRRENPHSKLTAAINATAAKSYTRLKREHIRDFQNLFNRVTLDLGKSSPEQMFLPTDQRRLMAATNTDPELEALMFQYGRYLLISCSRPGGLPANLQGLWNDTNTPAWHSDYHANINIEMNYWPAEVANLPECHVPLIDLIRSQVPEWRKTTAASKELKTPDGKLSTRGFAIRTSHNIYGGMGWKWDKTANAWYCHHLWDHFAYNPDTNYLQQIAYPLLQETCEYWVDHLKLLDDGTYVVPHGWSPEHGPDEDGVNYNQEIVWDLFDNFVKASKVMGKENSFSAKISQLRDHLSQPGVGSWGQLLEWRHEKNGTNAEPKNPELDTPNDHHRHTSHLFAVYPGHQISSEKNPALLKAAKVSLDARGISPASDVREWSFAWRTALYARMGDAAKAHGMLQNFFYKRNSTLNLFGYHPPMQIDGDFGLTAGIAEMLLQSDEEGGLEILPALPAEWPTGSVKGLRALGGGEVTIKWKEGKLVSVSITGIPGTIYRVKYGGKTLRVEIKNHKSAKFTPGDFQADSKTTSVSQ